MESLPDGFFDAQKAHWQAGKSLARARRIAGEALRELADIQVSAAVMEGDPDSYPGFSAAAAQNTIEEVARYKALWEETVALRRAALAEPDKRSSEHYFANEAIYHEVALKMNADYDRATAPD